MCHFLNVICQKSFSLCAYGKQMLGANVNEIDPLITVAPAVLYKCVKCAAKYL